MNYSDNLDEKDHVQTQKKTEKQSEHNKKLPKVVINISQTQYAVVRKVARKLKWILSTDPATTMNFDLCWTDNHVKQDTFFKMNLGQKINHFPGMEILSRKNNLGKNLMAFRNRFPHDYDFFPQTWMLPTDFQTLKEYHDNRQTGKAQTFIVKPEANCQGRGIFLTRNIDKLKGERCVVQRYLHKPFLIDGLKFDMRIYVLLAGTDPLRIFVYEQGLTRFATEPYTAPRNDNLDNKFMHLTNYAINKLSPNFVFNQSLEDCDKGHKRTLSSTFKVIEQMGYNSGQLKDRIDDMLIKTIITGYPTISKIQQSVHPQNYANDICFQILGFDVMLDHKLNPVILQVNYTPSFTTDTPLDKHIKKNLINDAIRIMGINQKWKNDMRKQREEEVRERMMTGKRKKASVQQKIAAVQHFAKQRDLYEQQNLGNFRKIFVKSEEQFQQYLGYYEFAQEVYAENNKLTASLSTGNSYYHIPFLKDQDSSKKRKEKREKSMYISTLYDQKKPNHPPTDFRKITSAKSMSKRGISTKDLLEEKKPEVVNAYQAENEAILNHRQYKPVFTKKKAHGKSMPKCNQ